MTENITSRIAIPLHVSQSELAALYPNYEADWEFNQKELLEDALYELGLDTKQAWHLQEVTQHRNRMNKVVTCQRYLGIERTDSIWLNSGFASDAAKDKAKNCMILDSIYRQRGLTEDVQSALEAKDFYRDKGNSEE